jgi:hypothetical protein
VNLRKIKNTSRTDFKALVDRGANGSIAGGDMRVIERSDKTINLCGLDDHTVRDLYLAKAGGVVKTSSGEIIIIVHHCADMTNDSKTIISAPQMEAFGCVVDDRSGKVTKRMPSIVTPGGYVIPITLKEGLPYIRMRPFNDDDWNNLPHEALTSPHEWDPAILDNKVADQWYELNPKDPTFLRDSILDASGNLKPELGDVMEDDGGDDRRHQAVDRGKIQVFLTKLIADELSDDSDDDEYASYKVSSSRSDRLSRRIRRKQMTTEELEKDQEMVKKDRKKEKGRRSRKSIPAPSLGKTEAVPETNAASPTEDDELVDNLPILASRADDSSSDEDDEEPRTDYNNPAKTLETSLPYLQRPSKRNIGRYAKYFPGTNEDTLKRTFDATTQYGTRGAVEGFNLRHRVIAANPVLSIPRRHEAVATDTLYSNTPAVDDGSTAAQFFIGRNRNTDPSLPWDPLISSSLQR